MIFVRMIRCTKKTVMEDINEENSKELKRRASTEHDIYSDLMHLYYCKNQFDSHLTFNFLSFCFARALHYSPELAEAIEAFSNMLRNSLYTKPEIAVPLAQEIKNIRDYVEIQRRISSAIFAEIEVKGNIQSNYIFPFLLIGFVENAFKHGNVADKRHPLKIGLEATCSNVVFVVENRKATPGNRRSEGVGFQNTQRMLEYHYQGKYQLEVEDTEFAYWTKLTLQIQEDTTLLL
jgi:two-component system LytT family sensor kinase